MFALFPRGSEDAGSAPQGYHANNAGKPWAGPTVTVPAYAIDDQYRSSK